MFKRSHTYIQLVQLRLDAFDLQSLLVGHSRQQQLCDGIDNLGLIGAERRRKIARVHLAGFAVSLVKDVLAILSESRWLAVQQQLLESLSVLSRRLKWQLDSVSYGWPR